MGGESETVRDKCHCQLRWQDIAGFCLIAMASVEGPSQISVIFGICLFSPGVCNSSTSNSTRNSSVSAVFAIHQFRLEGHAGVIYI